MDDRDSLGESSSSRRTPKRIPGGPSSSHSQRNLGDSPANISTTPIGGDSLNWQCSVCTFINPVDAFTCSMCETRKGTSTRKPRLNADNIVAQVVRQQEEIRQQAIKAGKRKSNDNFSDNDSIISGIGSTSSRAPPPPLLGVVSAQHSARVQSLGSPMSQPPNSPSPSTTSSSTVATSNFGKKTKKYAQRKSLAQNLARQTIGADIPTTSAQPSMKKYKNQIYKIKKKKNEVDNESNLWSSQGQAHTPMGQSPIGGSSSTDDDAFEIVTDQESSSSSSDSDNENSDDEDDKTESEDDDDDSMPANNNSQKSSSYVGRGRRPKNITRKYKTSSQNSSYTSSYHVNLNQEPTFEYQPVKMEPISGNLFKSVPPIYTGRVDFCVNKRRAVTNAITANNLTFIITEYATRKRVPTVPKSKPPKINKYPMSKHRYKSAYKNLHGGKRTMGADADDDEESTDDDDEVDHDNNNIKNDKNNTEQNGNNLHAVINLDSDDNENGITKIKAEIKNSKEVNVDDSSDSDEGPDQSHDIKPDPLKLQEQQHIKLQQNQLKDKRDCCDGDHKSSDNNGQAAMDLK